MTDVVKSSFLKEEKEYNSVSELGAARRISCFLVFYLFCQISTAEGMEIAQNYMGPLATNTMMRINENGNVVGTIIVNCEGFPETTTLDSLTAATYSTHMRSLSHYAGNALKEIDVLDELVVLRLVSKKAEAVVAPDHEFHLIVVMRRT